MLGPDVDYELDWTSIYTFQCRRMERFRHGRVIFAGDAAHQVSPFGARGANSGLQDADNLGWKLAGVIRGDYPETLLDSYDAERIHAADENIRNSTRSTDFITPKTPQSRVFRDAVLHLARHAPFARPMVNSGRLSVPAVYDGSRLLTRDALPGGTAANSDRVLARLPPHARLSEREFLLDHSRGKGGFPLVAEPRRDLPGGLAPQMPACPSTPRGRATPRRALPRAGRARALPDPGPTAIVAPVGRWRRRETGPRLARAEGREA